MRNIGNTLKNTGYCFQEHTGFRELLQPRIPVQVTIIVYENETTLKAQMSSHAVSLGGMRKYECKLIAPASCLSSLAA